MPRAAHKYSPPCWMAAHTQAIVVVQSANSCPVITEPSRVLHLNGQPETKGRESIPRKVELSLRQGHKQQLHNIATLRWPAFTPGRLLMVPPIWLQTRRGHSVDWFLICRSTFNHGYDSPHGLLKPLNHSTCHTTYVRVCHRLVRSGGKGNDPKNTFPSLRTPPSIDARTLRLRHRDPKSLHDHSKLYQSHQRQLRPDRPRASWQGKMAVRGPGLDREGLRRRRDPALGWPMD